MDTQSDKVSCLMRSRFSVNGGLGGNRILKPSDCRPICGSCEDIQSCSGESTTAWLTGAVLQCNLRCSNLLVHRREHTAPLSHVRRKCFGINFSLLRYIALYYERSAIWSRAGFSCCSKTAAVYCRGWQVHQRLSGWLNWSLPFPDIQNSGLQVCPTGRRCKSSGDLHFTD